MSKQLEVFRTTINALELNDFISLIGDIKQTRKLSAGVESLYRKLYVLAIKADAGIANPAYIQTGKKSTVTSVTVEALGGMMDSITTNNIPNNLGNTTNIPNINNNALSLNIPTITPEQKEQAELDAGMYYIEHGIKKDWREFINVPMEIPTNNTIDNSENSNQNDNDNDLYQSLFKEQITIEDL